MLSMARIEREYVARVNCDQRKWNDLTKRDRKLMSTTLRITHIDKSDFYEQDAGGKSLESRTSSELGAIGLDGDHHGLRDAKRCCS